MVWRGALAILLFPMLAKAGDAAPPPQAGVDAATVTTPATPSAPVAPAEEEAAVDMDAEDIDAGAGQLSERLISEVFRKGQWAVADCLTHNGIAGQAGRLVVELEIGLDGHVVRTSAKESNLANPMLQTCLLTAVRRLRFPVPEGGTVITTHPFIFQ